jgi:ribosomal protein S6--L-glutamate ligase
MKILIVGPKSKDNELLVAAAKKRKHKVLLTSLVSISLVIKNNKFYLYRDGKKMPVFDVCLFRGISPSFAKAKTMAKFLRAAGTRVVDRKLYSQVYEFDKMFMTADLIEDGLPVIDTWHFATYAEFIQMLPQLPTKSLIKDIHGMRSRNIFTFESRAELKRFFGEREDEVNNFVIQPKLDTGYYYRVFTVGGVALGAMKRMSFVNPERKNFSLNDRSTLGDMTVEMKRLAEKAAKSTHTDIAGIDIISDGRKLLIQEVNRAPQFTRFSEVTGIDVADRIVAFLEK